MYDDEDAADGAGPNDAYEAEIRGVRPPRDPVAIAGAAIVLGIAADSALDVWASWDRYSVPGAADRLRSLATLLGPYASTVLLIGIALLRLREWLGGRPPTFDDRLTRTGTGFGFAIALVFAIGSIAAAADVLLNSFGTLYEDGLTELTARLQYAGRYAIRGRDRGSWGLARHVRVTARACAGGPGTRRRLRPGRLRSRDVPPLLEQLSAHASSAGARTRPSPWLNTTSL